MEVIEKCNVSPPPNSIPTTIIPLTFFDVPWLLSPTVERILIYEFPHSTIYFTQTILPRFKHALSLTFQYYFPLAGSIVCTKVHTPPYILYKCGDSIPLTIVESKNNFSHLSNYCPKEVKEFRSLVPHLSNEIISISTNETDDQVTTSSSVQLIRPSVALQVTIFPNSGISISFAYRHVIDGRSINQFIKSWASIFETNNTIPLEIQPCCDRSTIIKDPNGLLQNIWKQWCDAGITWEKVANKAIATFPLENLHATFVINRAEIHKLRQWITSNVDLQRLPLSYVSTFVIASAFIWVCVIKTKYIGRHYLDDVLEIFRFPADCTGRENKNEFYVPKTYFGNCLIFCTASAWKHELLGKNGFFTAVKAIMTTIKERECGFLHGVDMWISRVGNLLTSNHVMNMTGSPKLRVYDTDFGWGRPKKSEIVHIDRTSNWQTISFMESRDDVSGVEVGIALSKADMKTFTSIFEQGLYNQ